MPNSINSDRNVRLAVVAIAACVSFESVAAADTATNKAATKADMAAEKATQAADEKKDQAADKVASDKAGGGPVVNGDSLTATTQRNAPAERFGRKGQIVISSEEAFTISNASTSGVSGSTTSVQLEPAVDYFFLDSWSAGGFVEFQYTSTGSSHRSTFSIGPRVGYNYTLSDLLSIWPKAGLSFSTTSQTSDGTPLPGGGTSQSITVSGSGVTLNLFVPLLFHPAPHFFAGLGPFLDTDLSGDSKVTTWGVKMTVGGWLL